MESTPHPGMTPEKRNALIEEYLPLVGHVLGRLTIHLPATLDREDLFETGVLGLMHAADTFNPSRGAIFKTHAYVAIRGAILDEIRKHDPVPRSRRDRVKQLAAAERRLAERLHRAATPEELAAETGLTVEQVEESLVNAHGAAMLSLEDAATGHAGDDERSLLQLLSTPASDDPSDLAANNELKERLAQAIHELPERERRVIVLYYAENLRLKEIGALLGVTESRACQIHARALLQLNRRVLGESAEAGAAVAL
ncbi:MAG TPA: FliA/WhiG family RNA polymerase sigma factor [Planctomycetota bacterium]|nr:FliA/WhiG family RNA polymerase sigma factor [Planctomycetota bacterium]